MIIFLGLVVEDSAHVHHDVTLTEDVRVPGPDNFSVTILWQQLEEDAGEYFVTVEGAIVCPDPDSSLKLVTHLDKIEAVERGLQV